MKHPDEDIKQTLDRLLREIGDPDADQMEQRIGSVARSLRSAGPLESQAQADPPDRVGPRRQRIFAVAFAAVAVMVVVTLFATVWKPVGPVASADATVMTLEDGSRVERSADSEVSVERVADGLRLHLKAGSIIVNAAKQVEGRHLYVVTKDVTVSVLGTVFFVKAGEKGSRVAVIQGVVNVKQGTVEKNLQPGEQMSSDPSSPSNNESQEFALRAEIGWSREAAAHLGQFHQAQVQQMARQDSPRTASVPVKPEFKSVSVQRCEENGARVSGGLFMSPGRLDVSCMDIATLIAWAHRPLANNSGEASRFLNLNYWPAVENGTRVRGIADWARSERYTISAVAEGSPDAPTMAGPMLMALFEDKLRLKLHVESEEIPVWELKVAKDGLQIKPIEPAQCPTPTGAPRLFNSDEERRQFQESLRGMYRCSFSFGMARPPYMRATSTGQTMGTFVRLLNQISKGMLATTLGGAPVVDKTGIPDTQGFDYVVEFPYDPEYPLQHPGEGIPMLRGAAGDTIFKALESIGLALERAKGLREFIVVDHVERPSPN